jgi:hypothetical protein
MKTQQLSTTMRAIYATGNEIGYTLFGLMPPTPTAPKPIPAGLSDIPKIVTDMIPEFQELRQHGQTGRDLVAVIYGAISTCIRFRFYMGSRSDLLLELSEKLRAYPQQRIQDRKVGQAASVPPLALAFLIGFSVDVFLSFLKTLSQSFTKRSDPEPRSKPAPAGT